jgi:hypothetical protein
LPVHDPILTVGDLGNRSENGQTSGMRPVIIDPDGARAESQSVRSCAPGA